MAGAFIHLRILYKANTPNSVPYVATTNYNMHNMKSHQNILLRKRNNYTKREVFCFQWVENVGWVAGGRIGVARNLCWGGLTTEEPKALRSRCRGVEGERNGALPSQLGDLRERRNGVWGGAPAENDEFWSI